MVSDIVLFGDLPEAVAGSLAAYAGCIAGAIREEEYLRLMEAAGFRDVHVVRENRFDIPVNDLVTCAGDIAVDHNAPRDAVRQTAGSVASVQVFGIKPA